MTVPNEGTLAKLAAYKPYRPGPLQRMKLTDDAGAFIRWPHTDGQGARTGPLTWWHHQDAPGGPIACGGRVPRGVQPESRPDAELAQVCPRCLRQILHPHL